MQIKRQGKLNKKPIIAALAAGLFLISLTGTLYALKLGPFAESSKDGDINLSAPSNDEKKAANTVKEQSVDGATKGGGNSDRAVAEEPTDGSKAESGLQITGASQSDGQLVVRTLIPVFTALGTCELSMVGPGGATQSASVPVQAMASSSTCAGFSIPSTALAKGTWKITVTLNNEKLLGSDTREVEIK